MASRGLGKVVDTLRRVTATPDADAELVERYLTDRDEVAFELLLHRHGPMVLGVCRRILGHAQDAEDAFQATFLVLVRKAESILPREQVGNWLYGVAQQTARKAWALRTRRARRETVPANLPDVTAPAPSLDADLAPVLDREISTLPAIYRTVLVLCDLEGKTRREAAEALGWREGTVAGRLARARKLLADRLARRGITSPAFAPVALPASLTSSTLVAAAAVSSGAPVAAVAGAGVAILTEGVLPMVSTVPLKIAAVLVVTVGLLGVAVGAGAGFGPAPSAAPPATVAQPEPPRADNPDFAALRALFAQDTPALPAQLALPARFDFKDTPLLTALDEVRVACGVNLWLNRPAIEKAGLALEQRVTCSVQNVPLLAGLNQMLAPCGLRARYADTVVQIEPLVLRAVSGDLVDVLREYQLRDVLSKPQGDRDEYDRAVARLLREGTRPANKELAQRAYAEQLAAARRLLARHQAVQDAIAALDKAIVGLRATTTDLRAEVEALDAIIQAAQEMKAKALKKP